MFGENYWAVSGHGHSLIDDFQIQELINSPSSNNHMVTGGNLPTSSISEVTFSISAFR